MGVEFSWERVAKTFNFLIINMLMVEYLLKLIKDRRQTYRRHRTG